MAELYIGDKMNYNGDDDDNVQVLPANWCAETKARLNQIGISGFATPVYIQYIYFGI